MPKSLLTLEIKMAGRAAGDTRARRTVTCGALREGGSRSVVMCCAHLSHMCILLYTNFMIVNRRYHDWITAFEGSNNFLFAFSYEIISDKLESCGLPASSETAVVTKR